MQKQPIESFNEFYATSLDVMKRLDKDGTQIWSELASEQLNMMRLWMDYWNRQLGILLSQDTPVNLFATHSGLVTEFSMKFVDQYRKMFTLLTDLGSVLMACSGEFKPYWSGTPSAAGSAEPSPEAAVSEIQEAVPRVIGKPKKSAA